VITVGILYRRILNFEGFKKYLRDLNQHLISNFLNLTNPSKRRIYLCKIPTVITETLIV
jgi:hypothetical protein